MKDPSKTKQKLIEELSVLKQRMQELEYSESERQQAEKALRVSEEKYRQVVENAKEAIIIAQDMKLVFANRAAVDMIRYSEEILTPKSFTDFIHPDDRNMVVDHHIRRLKGEEVPVAYSFRILNEDGTVKWVEFNTAVIQWKGRPATLSFLNDITARKQAEEALRESEELFRSYLEYAPDGVYMNDMEGNFLYGNRKCEEMFGYRREELIGKNFLELNILSENSLNKAVLLLQTNMKGKSTGPDEIDLISKEGRLIPVEINTNVVQRMGQRIVLAFVRNITERKQADEERAQSFEQMRKALRATVQAISITVEMRDPYTSGHQQRVADLARAIAKEMGLSEDWQDFIFTASTIHDIGKIAIPAEILSKPTKLIDLEFNLIKTHSQSGYDILKDIEFPWPVADVVLQHHERMDGSGYPQGLKGDDILLEARILAIADVVEAITFHRPYRPAIGINLALEEISRNKGILYDAAAVDACLKLFREKGYALVLKK
ncbi:MAG: PAS domain S-box protein [Smithellaceae bacterium]|jgi:PAS domain S-box-containing protein